MTVKKSLTNKQQVFVNEYLACWNATEAAQRAGYSRKTANEQGSRLLANVSVRDAITARIKELKAGADEVLLRLASHARGSMDDFVTGETLDLDKARRLGKMHLIKKFRVTTSTDGEAFETHRTEVELYDAQAATVQLAKILGQYITRIEVYDWRKEAREHGVDPDALVKDLFQKVSGDAA